MKNPHLRSLVKSFFICSFALCANAGFAASTISVSSGFPTVSGSGAATLVGQNNIGAAIIGGNLAKVSGTDTFVSSGGTGTLTLAAQGVLSANAGDSFSAAYNFTLGITGAGSLSWALSASIPGFGTVFTDSSGSFLTGPGSQNYTGVKSFTSPVTVSNVPWSFSLTTTWSGAANGDTVTVGVPSHSIDLSVAPPSVPEPSTWALLAVGIGGYFMFRRARSPKQS